MSYTVKQLAKNAGVSVRTLHYYDEIGLLKPTFIEENGYRRYEEKELVKLQQILFFKELEFPLEDIVQIVNAPGFDTLEALLEQRKFLKLKQQRIDSVLNVIDEAITTMKGGGTIMSNNSSISTTQDQLEEYKKEAKKRWGHTDAYKQSMERTKYWTKEDYQKAAEGWKKFTQELADTMDKGYQSFEFQSLIAKQHESVNQFYDCSFEMFRSLGNMYAEDPRFKKTYDDIRPGLAEFMKKAINYYCDQQEQ